MKQLELFTDEYQPRFQAFLKYKNAVSHTEVKMYEFIVWVSGHVADFKRIKSIEILHDNIQDEFTDYLWEQVK